jgi:transcription-repair coupling factor (superfamily II helicase)
MPNINDIISAHMAGLNMRLAKSNAARIYNLSVPHFALMLSCRDLPFIIVESSTESAQALYQDMIFFRKILPPDHPIQDILLFPPPAGPEQAGLRASVLYSLIREQGRSVITSPEAYRTGFSAGDMAESVFELYKGMEIERGKLRQQLIRSGYRMVNIVVEKGEFSERGWLFDIYPCTSEMPVRAEFFGDGIDMIRSFDIETQKSVDEIVKVRIFPAVEGGPEKDLVDLLPLPCLDLFVVDGSGGPKDGPDVNDARVRISHLPFEGEGIDSGGMTLNGLRILPEERSSMAEMAAALRATPDRVLAVLPSEAQARRLKDILFDGKVVAPIISSREVSFYEGLVCLVTGELSSGLRIPGLLLLTDREIFGERPAYRALKKSRVSKLLFEMDDLKPGDFVVHKDHGIGKFIGIKRQKAEEHEEDLITLEFSGGDRVYVPFQGVSRLRKYSGGEGHVPALEKLGGSRWQKTKQKVRQGVQEMAGRLLKLYAERTVSRGFVFSGDTPMHREFDEFFPYEETPDQLKAVEEITRHMNSETPMDMLLCGDVGYGKTEVAVRAAFRSVYDGKQVAVLAPTTLLAEQHFRTFRTRFSCFPVKIDYLSRFKNRADAKACIESLVLGEVDIVVGTHMLLNKQVGFNDLGLLIIDEEHRFGVAQKERLKELKKGVDVLTLTATPIPRTLQMSLSGIREMCTIETPPEERLAVRSIVTLFGDKTIKEAIDRELRRDGQIFFVHNRIQDMEKIHAYLRKLVPDARIASAHGRMRAAEMERIMLGFLNRETDILLCTAIIGSGLDIPTANTILIDRADTFGLSDLYQLRGRVGRGNVQAFAYFLIQGEDMITDEAKKRLKAIREMSYLGAGFRLALKDLEIRGAGNLLGAEQSGHIYKVGFDMYMEMLERAVSELKGEEVREEFEPRISLRLSAFIPEDYISDITLRLSIYKRMSSAGTIEALAELRDEMSDRFGRLPEEALNLIRVMSIKLPAKRLFISKVTDIEGRFRFTFLTDTEGKYGIPADFFERVMKALFEISSAGKEGERGRLRFMPDGFELDTRGLKTTNPTEAVEDTLKELLKRMDGAPGG